MVTTFENQLDQLEQGLHKPYMWVEYIDVHLALKSIKKTIIFLQKDYFSVHCMDYTDRWAYKVVFY